MFGRQRLHIREPFGNPVCNLARVAAGPDAGTIDAAASAIRKHAVDHHLQVRRPIIDHVVAEQNL